MRNSFAVAAFAASLLALAASPSLADRPGELEAARANARAGGPTNERDRELLERWGATSGTPGYSRSGLHRLDKNRHHGHYKKKRRHRD